MSTRPAKQAVLEQLHADGFRYMFGNPGTVEQGLLDLVDAAPGLDYVLGLQETVALAVADGYARVADRPALVQLHSGVGLGNGIGMLYQAKRGHTPLVVIAGEAGVRYEALDAQMAADLVAMARPVTKYATRVTDPGSVVRVLRRATTIAATHPRGPVFVALPADVLDAMTTEPVVAASPPAQDVVASEAALDRLERAARDARSPVLLVGDGVGATGGVDAVVALAERLGAPVWTVDSSGVNFPADHPLSRGSTGHMFGTASAPAVAGHDLVVVLGTYLFPEVFPRLESPFDPGATLVHVDLDTYEIGKNFPVDIAVAADPGLTAARWVERLGPGGPPLPASTPPPEPTTLVGAFAAGLRDAAGERLVVFDEALTASPDITAQLRPSVPGNYHVTRGGSLGVGIPGAIGAKLARPDACVVGFTGDGGSMYTIQALWTAARYGVAATFVVCNNRRYGLLDDNLDHYRAEAGEATAPYPSGFDLSGPDIDFVALAQGLGVAAIEVDKPEQVPAAVEAATTRSAPLLVVLRTD